MKVTGGIGAQGTCHGDAWLHKEPDGDAEQAVNAFANGHVLRPNAMMPGNRGAQIMNFRVAIFPRLAGRFLHGGNGLGRGAEDIFIGADAGAHGNAAAPENGFRADEGNGGGKAVDERGKAGHGAMVLINRAASDIIGRDKSMRVCCIAERRSIIK